LIHFAKKKISKAADKMIAEDSPKA
jgi:hypothetical protein